MTEYLQLTFLGHIPAKKNSSTMARRGGAIVRVPSKAYQKWEKQELPTLIGSPQFSGPVSIEYAFYPGGLKLFDLSNSIEGINDLLVKTEVIQDDNWAIIRSLKPYVAAFDRGNERCVVTIRSVTEGLLDEALAVLRDKQVIKEIAAKTKRTQKAVIAHYEELARGCAA